MQNYGSAINFVNFLIEKAHGSGASDIHLEPQARDLRIRFRVDGLLEDREAIPLAVHPEIISRLKIMSGLRTDEHRIAQDGRFRTTVNGADLDMRISVVPTHYGENAVLRLLSRRQEGELGLRALGFSETNKSLVEQALRKTQGLILITGPTGSGKTTTLYTLLQMLNRPATSIITIEDPIEYAIPGIQQIQTNTQRGLNFANGLRSILRQDPDIIMVGEIRDQETARLAVNAALTGHLLLSTLHTNSSAATLPRLLDLGVEPYLIAATARLIVNQRLVRKLQDNGFAGRTTIQEVLAIDDTLRNAISQRLSLHRLQQAAEKAGMASIYTDGLAKVEQGITTLEEILRVVEYE